MAKIALFVVTIVKVARLGSGVPTICGKWAHKDCTGADTLNDYMCDFCNNE
jgi:hypothetical protein